MNSLPDARKAEPDYDYDDGTCQRCGGEGFVFECFDGYCEDAEVGCDDCTRECPECRRRSPSPQALEGQ